jgi:hypothetical protein
MWTRRELLCRASGTLFGVSGLGLGLRALCQDNTPDGSMSRGMITPRTQEAIDRGLAFLARSQNQDGSFGTNQHRGNIAITSLGGLAFMAGGHQPGRGRYGRVVTNALRFVLSKEDRGIPGYLHNQNSSLHGPMYGHGFGTLFLAEVYGMAPTRQLRTELRGTLDRSVKLIINSQNAEGGWRYRPERRDADLSVTICQIMALRAARNAGIAVPKSVAKRCTEYVKACQSANDGGFRYQKHTGPTGFARTAAGVVALYSAGIYEGNEVKGGLDFLKQFRPGAARGGFGGFQEAEMRIHYYYGHYYAAQAMWTAGGDYWREWYPAIRDELLRPEGGGGHRQDDGSWFDHRICPHYSTAMALIILQIPNNYLPILQR